MQLSNKIADIKEKITQLVSKMEQLRLENNRLVEENSQLKIKLQRDADELDFMRHQLAALKERQVAQLPQTVVEEEE